MRSFKLRSAADSRYSFSRKKSLQNSLQKLKSSQFCIGTWKYHCGSWTRFLPWTSPRPTDPKSRSRWWRSCCFCYPCPEAPLASGLSPTLDVIDWAYDLWWPPIFRHNPSSLRCCRCNFCSGRNIICLWGEKIISTSKKRECEREFCTREVLGRHSCLQNPREKMKRWNFYHNQAKANRNTTKCCIHFLHKMQHTTSI